MGADQTALEAYRDAVMPRREKKTRRDAMWGGLGFASPQEKIITSVNG